LATKKSGAVIMPEQINAAMPVVEPQDAIAAQGEADVDGEPVRRKRR